MTAYRLREAIPDSARSALKPYSPFLQELLYNRGITTVEDAEYFLHPDYDQHVSDPFLVLNMDRAVDRILKAIKKNEKIIIYSDYDHDGVPGGVVLHDFFAKIEYANFENYIPHRYTEGYSLNLEAVEKLREEGATLLITVDCGITDIEHVTSANKIGLDVIITDHHLPLRTPDGKDLLPPAYAVLNSKQQGDSYPDDMLCGAGVAFKLVQGLIARGNFPAVTPGWEKWLLDMVGIATVADMVPLVRENRALAHYGLTVLRRSPRPGLQHLFKKTKINQGAITEDDIGFMIAPRINAASRMGVPKDAFTMLSTKDEVEGSRLAAALEDLNDERKGIVASMVKEIKKKVAERELHEKEVIVLGNPDWRPGLLGLVANSVMEAYSRPVFLWGREGGTTLKGSCRSNGSVNVVTLMTHVGDTIFAEFGGHALSGGFSLHQENVHLFEERLIASYVVVKDNEGTLREIVVDRTLDLDDVNWRQYAVIEQMAPFGMGNAKPTFLFENVEIAGVKNFGKQQNHLELSFENSMGKKVTAIGFFMTVESASAGVGAKEKGVEGTERMLVPGTRINLIATMEKSQFRGFKELRLRIVDVC